MKLKSIAEEAADCREAFKNSKIGDIAVHYHHDNLAEKLNEPAKNRITYILAEKPEAEQALTLRLFRPIPGPALAEYELVRELACAEYMKVQRPTWAGFERVEVAAWAKYLKAKVKAHKLICKEKDCPWNGKTIFS